MSGFWIGLASGIVLAVIAFLVLYILFKRGTVRLPGLSREGLYHKILVASVGQVFSERSLYAAVRVVARKGLVETLYVLEIPLDHPLGVAPEEGLNKGMETLDMAARWGRYYGMRFLPRLEKVRMGSKAILDLQRKEGFDLLVLDVGTGEGRDKDIRKIAEYVRENATCTVMVLSGGGEPPQIQRSVP